ncbi:MAG: acetylxylan esterase [Planctomycetaceae bacterium]|nr:acetylxylan esterase [Planctomycetaceae bacterium]
MRTLPLALVLLLTSVAWSQDDLRCLENPQPYYSVLQQRAYEALDRRSEALKALQSPEDIRAYQQRQREFFLQKIGEFPAEKCPLNAVTTRVIEEDGYRIENVIFDSRPHHRITANLYLPKGKGPFAGVVVASGHSRTAKTADYNQRFALMMVRNGMAALCIDPIGQGERSQILNEEHHNQFSGTTTEHFLVGVGSILVGRNTAHYEIWDGMRAIDYLVSRPEIDPDKIGMTGCSGGGTQTSYVMALDDRVKCAAPSCYITTFRDLVETIGPQDSEQNIFGQIEFGMDHPDYLIMRAPRPTIMSATNDDFFPIAGSWDALREAKQIYGRLGYPERVDLVEGDGKHGVPPQNLATIGHWMRRWLLNNDEALPAVELKDRPAEDLLCTESGQVLSDPEEQSVSDLNAALAAELFKKRKQLWETSSVDEMRSHVRARIGVSPKAGVTEMFSGDIAGLVQRDEYTIAKYVVRWDAAPPVPVLVFRPKKVTRPVCLYLHPDGKEAVAGAGSEIEELVKSGATVVAIDLSGQGETAREKRTDLHGDWKTFYLSYLLGESLVGTRVVDTLMVARFAAAFATVEGQKLDILGVGEAGIVALHAAAIAPEQFGHVRLKETPADWTSIVSEPIPSIGLDYTVHGVLEEYDLPDLEKLIGEGKVERLK